MRVVAIDCTRRGRLPDLCHEPGGLVPSPEQKYSTTTATAASVYATTACVGTSSFADYNNVRRLIVLPPPLFR